MIRLMNASTSAPKIEEVIASFSPLLQPAVQRMLRQLDGEEIQRRSVAELVSAARSLTGLAAQRSAAETQVEVLLPEPGADWEHSVTVVNICTADAPFLVDSVSAAVARHGLGMHLLLHPLVSVRRSEAGELLETGVTGGTLESWIHLQLDRLATAQQAAELQAALQKVLADVHAAVADWRQMRRACLDIVTDLRTTPPTTVEQASVQPAVEFLNWLADDNFTFLGYREHVLEEGAEGELQLRALPETGLGILRGQTAAVSPLTPEAQRTARDPRLLTITKANSRATVHRDVYLDYIGVRTFDEAGNVTGERRFLGMFTSAAYNTSVLTLPIVAAKANAVVAMSGHTPTSHSGKDLLQVLEQYPRDELFQDTPEHLLAVATEVGRLRKRRRSRAFLRRDEFGRFVSALVYMPRDRHNTTVRLRIEKLLCEVFGTTRVDHTTRVGDSPLAQLHFVLRMPRGAAIPEVDEDALQAELEAVIRGWDETLQAELGEKYAPQEAAELLARYGQGFPEAYKEAVSPRDALRDIELMERLRGGAEFAVRLYSPETHGGEKRVFTLASRQMHPLTEVLPVLTNLGVDVVDERPYRVTLSDGSVRYLSDFGLAAQTAPDSPAFAAWQDAAWGGDFEDAFAAVWRGDAESDALNALVLHAGMPWEQVLILRAIAMYLRQIGSAFSVEYIEQALVANPQIARDLVALFVARFQPAAADAAGVAADAAVREPELAAVRERILAELDGVSSLDHDRILRAFVGVIEAAVRTNYFQRTAAGARKPCLSLKLRCAAVPGIPKPVPMFEIWVYSPEVEGVHLRFGKVARGGLRWSDRREDFRTEVLGLVKAQMVKNAVIVPTGSKGGFFGKRLPDPALGRAEWLEAGKAAYRTFIRGLLDLTDNRQGDQVVTPAGIVRWDEEDPYLVVAADKGTASFSDIANSISAEYGFWLDDAFASGGSEGYDHKGMGITARGAWESVKRHFRELGHDTQSEDFTVVGVGDMSGDVFGNGMLRSQHIRLVAAFDHRHVFVDPTPDAAASFAERQRLFELPGSSWDDYDRSLISAGGGVFPLSAKSIPVSPEMREALGLAQGVTKLTPGELKRAVLLAPVDLLWNGGIGTYVKASSESNAEIGDRGNDAIRVNGNELRVRVVGEGGNLGVSQRGRIEAAVHGVRINTDAIDNSAGVGTSDREVNIKILLGQLERAGVLDRSARNELLRSMTDEVGVQVLRDNYEQNVLLGNSRENAVEMLPSHERLIEWLEGRDELDRELEFLPSQQEVAARIEEGRGLTRPEFAVLVAYAKLALKHDLALTALADDPWFQHTLAEYFPRELRERYGDHLAEHPLRTEIIVNSVVNSMVNRGGITFAYRAQDETGASAEQIARAYVVAREVFGLADFVAAVEATDNVVPTAVQTELYLSFRRLLDRATRWLVQHDPEADIASSLAKFAAPVAEFVPRLGELLQGEELARYAAEVERLQAAGVPAELAARGAGLVHSLPLLDVVALSAAAGRELAEVAELYFALSARVQFDEMLQTVTALPQSDRWGAMARAALRDDLYAVMVGITDVVLRTTAAGSARERIVQWLAAGGATVQHALDESIAAVRAEGGEPLATLSVALRRLRSLVR